MFNLRERGNLRASHLSRHQPILAIAAAARLVTATPPMIGDKAPDFALSTAQGKTVRWSEVAANGPVVLVVLRGIRTRSHNCGGFPAGSCRWNMVGRYGRGHFLASCGTYRES